VTVADTATATTLDASGLTGDLTLTANTGALVDVLGPSGDATYTTGTATNTFQGQGGADDVTVGALVAGARVAVQMGAGADTLTLQATAANNGDEIIVADMGSGNDTVEYVDFDGELTLEGGAGSDTLEVTNGDDLSGETMTLTGMEVLAVQDAAAGAVVAQTLTVDNDQIESFTSISILPPVGTSDDTLAVTVSAEEASVDLSGLTVGDSISFTINGTNGTTTTIVGSSADDTIDAGTAATSVTGGAGDNDYTIADGDSTEASMMAIQDYKAAAAAGDNDTLTIGTTDVVTDATVDVSAVGTIFASTTGTVNAVVTDGMMTLTGTASDRALANTLAEYIDIAEAVIAAQGDDGNGTTGDEIYALGFVFGGDTYVLEFTEDATTAGDYDTTTVVRLVGITDADEIAGTAAADTILIA